MNANPTVIETTALRLGRRNSLTAGTAASSKADRGAHAVCASSGSQQGGGLTGKVWALSELNGKPLVPGSGITAEFTTAGQLSGSAGCNRYSSQYTVSGSNMMFSSPIAATMMMCAQPLMEQESAYLNALGEAKTYAVSGDQLTLSGADKITLALSYQIEGNVLELRIQDGALAVDFSKK